jgi:Transmembrane protein 65
MDQCVMISCGDLIDSTLGVRFGLATLTAAACGQVFSDVTGVCFGGVVQSFATKLGLPEPDLTPAQRKLRYARVCTGSGRSGRSYKYVSVYTNRKN